MPSEKRITLDLLDVRSHLDERPDTHCVRWVPTTSMLVDCFTKHLADLTVLNTFLRTSLYSCREDIIVEQNRMEAQAKRKANRRNTKPTTTSTTESSAA